MSDTTYDIWALLYFKNNRPRIELRSNEWCFFSFFLFDIIFMKYIIQSQFYCVGNLFDNKCLLQNQIKKAKRNMLTHLFFYSIFYQTTLRYIEQAIVNA